MLQIFLTFFVILFAPIPWIISAIHILVMRGLWKLRTFKILVLIGSLSFWSILGILLFSNHELLFTGQFENMLLQIMGIVVLSAAAAIEFLTHQALGTKRIFGKSEFKQTSDTLITHGIYRYARHPRYVEHPLWALGLGMVFGYPSLLWFFLYLSVGFAVVVHFEELELVKRYGKEYLEYRKKTPAFL